MRKEITKTTIVCDICRNEITEHDCINISYPVVFLTEQTEGRPTTPYINQKQLDMCKTCAKKALKVEATGAQGYNNYTIREG